MIVIFIYVYVWLCSHVLAKGQSPNFRSQKDKENLGKGGIYCMHTVYLIKSQNNWRVPLTLCHPTNSNVYKIKYYTLFNKLAQWVNSVSKSKLRCLSVLFCELLWVVPLYAIFSECLLPPPNLFSTILRWCYYPFTPRDSVSPICRIFTYTL